MGNIITIDFHGDRLLGIESDTGPLIPLRPLVLGMGLDWSGQLQRIRRDPILAEAVVMTPTGSDPEAVCLPLNLVPGFLFRIDASRVKEAVRAKVIDYQRSCFDVLAQAFARPPREQSPNLQRMLPDETMGTRLAKSLVTEARQTFGDQAARQMWFKLRLPLVPAMHGAPYQGSLFEYDAQPRGGRP